MTLKEQTTHVAPDRYPVVTDFESAPLPCPNDAKLFRPEAIQAACDRFGTPARLIGLPTGTLTVLMTALFVAVVAFLSLARFARKEIVSGVLQPAAGAMAITAPRMGVIVAVHARESQELSAGQPIVTLETDPRNTEGRRQSELLLRASEEQSDALEQQIAAVNASLVSGRAEIAEKRASLRRELKSFEERVAIQQKRMHIAEQTAEASASLLDKRYVPAVTFLQHQDALYAMREALTESRQRVAAIPSRIAELDAREHALIADSSRLVADLKLQLGQLLEKRVSIGLESRINLVAQASGRVTSLRAKPGTAIAANSTVAVIIPSGVVLQAELWVPSRAIGFIRPGNQVRLMYEAFPYQRFGAGTGKVSEVDLAPTAPASLPVPMQTEEALYRVVVHIDQQEVSGYGQQWPLVPGMKLSADIILENQSLLGWVFDDVRASMGRRMSI